MQCPWSVVRILFAHKQGRRIYISSSPRLKPALLCLPSAALHSPQQHPVFLPREFRAEGFPCFERGSREQGHVKHTYKLQNLRLTLPQAAQM